MIPTRLFHLSVRLCFFTIKFTFPRNTPTNQPSKISAFDFIETFRHAHRLNLSRTIAYSRLDRGILTALRPYQPYPCLYDFTVRTSYVQRHSGQV